MNDILNPINTRSKVRDMMSTALAAGSSEQEPLQKAEPQDASTPLEDATELLKARSHKYVRRERKGQKWVYYYKDASGKEYTSPTGPEKKALTVGSLKVGEKLKSPVSGMVASVTGHDKSPGSGKARVLLTVEQVGESGHKKGAKLGFSDRFLPASGLERVSPSTTQAGGKFSSRVESALGDVFKNFKHGTRKTYFNDLIVAYSDKTYDVISQKEPKKYKGNNLTEEQARKIVGDYFTNYREAQGKKDIKEQQTKIAASDKEIATLKAHNSSKGSAKMSSALRSAAVAVIADRMGVKESMAKQLVSSYEKKTAINGESVTILNELSEAFKDAKAAVDKLDMKDNRELSRQLINAAEKAGLDPREFNALSTDEKKEAFGLKGAKKVKKSEADADAGLKLQVLRRARLRGDYGQEAGAGVEGAGEGRGRSSGGESGEPSPFLDFNEAAESLFKARGHKYIKRERVGNRWKYTYKEGEKKVGRGTMAEDRYAKDIKYTGDIDKDFKTASTVIDVIASVVAGKKTQKTTEADPLEKHLVARMKAIYKNNSDWGKKIVRAENGTEGARDAVYMWMEHWADAYVKNPERAKKRVAEAAGK